MSGPGWWRCRLCGITGDAGGGDALSDHIYRCHWKADERGIWSTR